ncbi:MAG: nucleotide-binding protein [Tessaracoccus sp.]
MIIPESVAEELRAQRHHEPGLAQIFDAEWITIDRSDDVDFLAAFASYEQRLVQGRSNRGECGVLALGKVRGYELVIDDGHARQIASEEADGQGLRVIVTLTLLCDAIRQGQLTVPMVESLADDLLEGEYHLPFRRGGFRAWAMREGLVDP